MPRSSPKLVFALAAASLMIGPSPARAGPAEDQYAVAAGHYSQGRWKLAVEEFQRFLADYPSHAKADRAVFYLAESLVQQGQFDEAGRQFREFLKRAPNDRLASKALFRAGEASYLSSRWDDAQRDLSRFLAQSPDDPLNAYVLPYLGEIALAKHDAAAAQQAFSKGLQRFPHGALEDDCRFGLAEALEMQGENKEARRWFLALAGKPKCPRADAAQFRLGANQYAAGEYAAALESFQALESKFTASRWKSKAGLGAGQSLFYLQRLAAARERFAALAGQPGALGQEARYWLGLTQKAERDWAGAGATLLAAAESAAADDAAQQALLPAVRFHAGDALLHAGRVDQALEQFELVLQKWPQSELADDCRLGKIEAALAAGSHDRVDSLAAEFHQAFPASPLNAAVDRCLVRSLLARKQPAKAVEIAEQLLTAGGQNELPDDAATHRYLLALAYAAANRCDDALRTIEPVLSGPAGELKADAQRVQATALIAQEKFAAAVAPLQAYLAARAGDPEAAAWALGELSVALAHGKQLERAKQTYAALLAKHAESPLVPATTAALAELALAADDEAWSDELFAALARQSAQPAYLARGLSGTAWSQYRAGKLPLAAATFERVLNECPAEALAAEAALARGRILEQLHEAGAALAMYRLLIDKYPASPHAPQALLAAARLHTQLKQGAAAAALYQDLDRQLAAAAETADKTTPAVALPDRDTVIYEWAWVLRDLGRAGEADALFERLRAAAPRGPYWPDAVFRLAERAHEAKDFPRVKELLAELLAAQADPQVTPHALYLQALEAVGEEKWSDVVPPLARLLGEFPEHALRLPAEYLLADVAFRQGDYEAAGRRFADMAQRVPDGNDKWRPTIALRQAQVLAEQKKWQASLELAERIESDYPAFEQRYEVDYLLGRCLSGQGRFDLAREAYRRAIRSELGEKTETAAKAQWMIGESYFHQENYGAALREYLRVDILYDFPTWQALALLQAGKCHEKLGEWKEASELYARILRNYGETRTADEAGQRLRMAQERAQAKN